MLGIIIVNYKTNNLTSEYVLKELSKIQIPKKIIIVDNGCDNIGLSKELAAKINGVLVESEPFDRESEVFVIHESNNLGYAIGNNIGAIFLDRYFDIDYLLVTNNDIVLLEDNVIETLVNVFKEFPDVGMVGPYIEGVNGAPVSPFVKPSLWRHTVIPFLLYPFLILMNKSNIANMVGDYRKSDYCYRLSGCFMLLRKDSFFDAGLFDENTFLYSEEPILSERFLAKGYRTYFCDSSRILHNHGYTSKKYASFMISKKRNLDSTLYYFRQYRDETKLNISIARFSFELYKFVWYPVISFLVKVKASFLKKVEVDG